ALARNGIDLQEVPLYLVLGSPGRELSEALMRSTGYEWLVNSCPDGRAPLRWFASSDAVFLLTEETGCLSRLASLAGRTSAEGERAVVVGAAPSISGTLVTGTAGVMATAAAPGPMAAAPRAPAIRGTLVPDAASGDAAGGAPARSA